MSDDIPSRVIRIVPLAFLCFIAALAIFDLNADLREGRNWLHLMLEAIVAVSAVIGVGTILGSWTRQRRLNDRLQHDLVATRRLAAKWRGQARDLLVGLADMIDRQFGEWNLTEAEREIALLLLKGFSFKEIALLRATSERTVRQQSLAIYRKAGLAGRAQFSAFFLEDLLLPIDESRPFSDDS